MQCTKGKCGFVCGVQDLETIETIWQLTQDWEGHWSSWKVGQFTELQTSEMENQSVTIFKKLNKFSRELKVRAGPSLHSHQQLCMK